MAGKPPISHQLAALPAHVHPADALEHYTQTKAVYQALEPNQPWL
jgi:hypothetical protein